MHIRVMDTDDLVLLCSWANMSNVFRRPTWQSAIQFCRSSIRRWRHTQNAESAFPRRSLIEAAREIHVDGRSGTHLSNLLTGQLYA